MIFKKIYYEPTNLLHQNITYSNDIYHHECFLISFNDVDNLKVLVYFYFLDFNLSFYISHIKLLLEK